MSRITFLRIRHICTAPFALITWIISEVLMGFVDGIIGWWVELAMALKDPIAFEMAQRAKAIVTEKDEREMMAVVNSYDNHP